MEAFEIKITPVHDIVGAGFQREVVENVHIVQFPFCNADESGDGSAQIQQCMEFHRRLVAAKSRPRKQIQAQVDSSRVQGIQCFLQVKTQFLLCMEFSGASDKPLSEVGIQVPVAYFIRIGQSTSRHPTANPHVIEQTGPGTKTCFDISKALSIGELGKGHTKKLVPTSKAAYFIVSRISLDQTLEVIMRYPLHELGENKFFVGHGRPWHI